MNKVILEGRIGQEPRLRTFENGGSIVSFSVATNEGYYDKNNNWVPQTEWHNIVYSGHSVEKIAKTPKGTEVLIEGKIRTRSYNDSTGKEVSITEIVTKSVKAFGLKTNENGEQQHQHNYNNQTTTAQQQGMLTPAIVAAEDDDDLPF